VKERRMISKAKVKASAVVKGIVSIKPYAGLLKTGKMTLSTAYHLKDSGLNRKNSAIRIKNMKICAKTLKILVQCF
jgi:hypothetical protein